MCFISKYKYSQLLLCCIFFVFLNSCNPEEVPEVYDQMNMGDPKDSNIKDPIIIKPLTGNEHNPSEDRGTEPDPEEPII